MLYYVKICKGLYSTCCIDRIDMSKEGHIVYKFNLTTVEQNYTNRGEIAMKDVFTTNWYIYRVYLSSTEPKAQDNRSK